MRFWNGHQWKHHFDTTDVDSTVDSGPHPDGQVFLGDKCEHCGERVRYWNTGVVGNAACGCTVEGPEVCEVIGPQHELEPTEEVYG